MKRKRSSNNAEDVPISKRSPSDMPESLGIICSNTQCLSAYM